MSVKCFAEYSLLFLLDFPMKIHIEYLLQSFLMSLLVENLVYCSLRERYMSYPKIENLVVAPNVKHLVMNPIVDHLVVNSIEKHLVVCSIGKYLVVCSPLLITW